VYVIYGDSITDNNYYPRVLENYILTRFPKWNMTFFNYGWGGDVAPNLFRLERDVLPVKPTVFTENMGMNDGRCCTINSITLKTYADAYPKMVPMLKQANPEVRIGLVSSIPFENRFSSGVADGAYAQTLRVLAQAKARLATELNVDYFDLYTGYAEEIGKGKIVYPDFILSGDGIHPFPVGQTIMAMVILRAMNAPSRVAGLTLDARAQKVLEANNCEVKELKTAAAGELSFQRLAFSLPCPVEEVNEQNRRFLDVVGFADKINLDQLTVKGLSASAYELKINGVAIDTYSASELAAGVNINETMSGPIWDQALSVMQATLERQRAHFTKWRTVLLPDTFNGRTESSYDTSNKKRIDELDVQAHAAIQKQHQLNQPGWFTFTLTPVAEKPLILPEPVTFSNCGQGQRPPVLEPLDWVKPACKVKSLDLRSVVNRGFADDVAGDTKGGWSDQGPQNDLYSFPIGRQILSGVPFDVIDPKQNHDKSMIVLSRRPEQKLPHKITIPVNANVRAVTFLHVGAWMTVGEPGLKLTFVYSIGTKVQTTVVAGIHLADWWSGPQLNLPGGCLAWKGDNRSGFVGVYYAPFENPRPDLKIEALELECEQNAGCVYGLIAATVLE
jgi:hypothetical protein